MNTTVNKLTAFAIAVVLATAPGLAMAQTAAATQPPPAATSTAPTHGEDTMNFRAVPASPEKKTPVPSKPATETPAKPKPAADKSVKKDDPTGKPAPAPKQ